MSSLLRRADPRLDRDRDRLVLENRGLVRMVARRYLGRGVPLEDLVQEGCLGLIRAAEKFDPGRGIRFSTYAVYWIRRFVLRALPRADVPAVVAEADLSYPLDPPAPGDDDGRDLPAGLFAAVAALGPRGRAVIALRLGFDGPPRTRAEAAEALGVTPGAARAAEEYAVAALRAAFHAEPAIDPEGD